jgi:membrane-bound lytic murein transglycosylase B
VRKAAAPAPAPAQKTSTAPQRCLSGPDREPYAQRRDVADWAAQVAAQFPDLDAQWLRRSLGQACYQPDVARLIMPAPAGQARNWAAYRARFVEPQRIRAGLEFWSANQRWLAAAQARYGVPAEIIVGIIGVETIYGRQTGRFRVLDALATLSFDFPSGRSDRSPYFREQLAALLRLASKEGLEATDIRGSYAGAIGWAQFMPGSWLSYAVDFNGDSRIDLQGSVPDVIGSVANFLSAHGWQSGMPARFGVKPPEDPDQLALLLVPDIRPSFTRHELVDAGAVLDEAGSDHSGLLALVELENGADRPASYVAGTENFWTLTRYNWSAYYAMAVLDLGASIAAQRGRGADLAVDPDEDRPTPAKARNRKLHPRPRLGTGAGKG